MGHPRPRFRLFLSFHFFKKWAIPGLLFAYFFIQTLLYFYKMGHPRPLFVLFIQTLQFLQQLYVKKSIQYTMPGFEPITFRFESHPISTRLGLPPSISTFLQHIIVQIESFSNQPWDSNTRPLGP